MYVIIIILISEHTKYKDFSSSERFMLQWYWFNLQ